MNRFYTLMVIPEKTSTVRKIIVPAWAVRAGLAGAAAAVLLIGIMFFDYWYVMNQISENKQLKLENRRLRQQVQVYNDRLNTIDSTLERVRTFATRLKVITNIEDHSGNGLLESLNLGKSVPEAARNIGLPQAQARAPAQTGDGPATGPLTKPLHPSVGQAKDPSIRDLEAQLDEEAALRRDFSRLSSNLDDTEKQSSWLEQVLHDEYELLADKKSFLLARPTRRPAQGFYTSGFGVRRSPFGGKIKMHEGLDIANVPGTPIRAPADGVVEFASVKAGYGQTVILNHGYGLETWYGHTKKILVKPGQKVKRGDAIALLGNTGQSTGPHVHYEVRVRGTPVDPLSYILED